MVRRTAVLIYACAAFLWAGQVVTTQTGEVYTAPRSSSTPTRLIFPYVVNQAGFDTEITISNTSQDTAGSAAQAGACTLSFYGYGAPAASTSVTIPAGKQLVFSLLQGGGGIPAVPSNFAGYMAASCGFPLARGTAKVYAPGHLGFSSDAQVITLPRSTAKPQYLLFPFVTNQSGFDTGFTIANTSSDPFGTASSAGACTFYFYGASAPAPLVTPAIAFGTVWSGLASNYAPGFQGYVIASCNFPGAAGTAFVADLGARYAAFGESAELIAGARVTAANWLLFPSVANLAGMDTGITIANASADPFGTTSSSGSCSLNFYGSNAPAPFSTPSIPFGTVYTTQLSTIARGFQGYVVASCPFPRSRGWAYTAPLPLANSDGDSVTAEVITATPRAATVSSLLFTDATNWNGADTVITISNTSQDPFGTTQGSGACTIFYFGDMAGGGSVPAAQTSTPILPGGQLSFSLSRGNSAQGIPGAPGFRGYVIADCTFPLARGVATMSVNPPALAISKTHSGSFTQGQNNATYTVTVSNAAAAGATSPFGAVTVTETVPSGLTLVSMAGTGWTCASTTCTRGDVLNSGASYPAITATVNVAANASSPQINQASVSGGASANASTTDSTTIAAAGHPAFFAGEAPLTNGVYYLQLPNGNLFGYYTYIGGGWNYHFDMGYEYVSPGAGASVYLWDMSSTHWLYTSTSTFPYLYDFTLNAWIYYFPDTKNPGHYTTNPRYFVNMTTSQIFMM